MKKPILFSLLIFLSYWAYAKITPTHLRCEYLSNPPLIDLPHPRLSWINTSDPNERGHMQASYEIRVASTLRKLISHQADLWSSGKIKSNPSSNKPLTSRQDCW